MKIENNSLSSLSSQPADSARRVDKKELSRNSQVTHSGSDKVEMSGDARLLAKARVALNSVNDTDDKKLAALRERIESGDYTVQVMELARKLTGKYFPK